MSARTVSVELATDEDLARFYSGITFTVPWAGKVMRRGRLVTAFGGAAEQEEGVWLAFLDVPAHMRRPSLYRHARAFLAELKGRGARVIRASVDDDIPRAFDFMDRLGFRPTDDTIDGRTVYEWRS